MTRPHEDLERHTPTDHRPGGVPVDFAPGAWCAVDVVHVKANRVDAGISAYETLIEKARTASPHARTGVVFRSVNDRRVIVLVAIDGHVAFRHLQTAWDDHHLNADRHAVAESTTLALYRVIATTGAASFDPEAHDAYAFERVARAPDRLQALVPVIAAAPGFRGVVVFGSDDASTSAIVYRFAHAAEFDAFRASAAARQVLGDTGTSGESVAAVHPVRTFG